MLRSIKDIIGYPVSAVDGQVGKIKDCLFDDRHWRLRYLTVETGSFFTSNRVTISPLHAKDPATGWSGKSFPVDLTREEIENSPKLEENAPVSHQYEVEFARYYRMTQPYWAGSLAWGATAEPIYFNRAETAAFTKQDAEQHDKSMARIAKSHLRSAHEIIGYGIKARDKTFGHVEDFIIETETWRLHYLIIDTRNWLPGKKSLIDIGWIEAFDWNGRVASVGLTEDQIKNAPEFDPRQPVNRNYEKELYDYYGRPCHWKEVEATSY